MQGAGDNSRNRMPTPDMSALSRVFRAISEHGIRGAGFKLYAAIIDRSFDLWYGVDTCRWVTLDTLFVVGSNKVHGQYS